MTATHKLRAVWSRQSTRRKVLIIGGVAGTVIVSVAVILNLKNDNDGLSLIDASDPRRSYIAVFLLVFFDAVIPIFPGETTVNAAATAAAQGALELWPIIVAASLGAIIGDSTLFWIARRFSGRVQPTLEKAQQDARVKQAYELMNSSAPLLIVGGRYVPGMRFVVNVTMGLSEIRYRRFLLWSAIGGVLWGVYTSVLAYEVATALSGFPLASVVISGLVTTTALAVIFLVIRKRRRTQEHEVAV